MGQHLSPANVLITVALLALVVYRNVRPRRMSEGAYWIFPIILVVLTGWLIYSTVAFIGFGVANALALAIGIAAGIPFGLVTSHHSEIKLTEKPGIFYVHPSVVAAVIWVIAFGLRMGLRLLIPNAGTGLSAASDGFIVFAVASVLTSRVRLFQRYLQLKAAHAPT